MASSTESKEGRFNTLAVALGVVAGIVVGSVMLAITQSPVWLGLGIPFGAALGIIFGKVLQQDQQ